MYFVSQREPTKHKPIGTNAGTPALSIIRLHSVAKYLGECVSLDELMNLLASCCLTKMTLARMTADTLTAATRTTLYPDRPHTVDIMRRWATRMQDVSADTHERTHTLEGRDTVSLRQPQRETSAGWNTHLTARHNPHGAAENTRVRRPGWTDESFIFLVA